MAITGGLGSGIGMLILLVVAAVFCEATWKRVTCGIIASCLCLLGMYANRDSGWAVLAVPMGMVTLAMVLHSIKKYTS